MLIHEKKPAVMHEEEKENNRAYAVIAVMSLFTLFLHLAVNAFTKYGIFRDEFYYLACSSRLDTGYVDHPPLSIWLLKLSTFFFGDSLFAIRLFPAIAGAATVLVTGLLVRKLKGGITAIFISSLALIIIPVHLAFFTIYSMNAFDVLFWILAAYIIALIIENNSLKDWIILGVVLGLALLNKISALWLCAGIGAGFLLQEDLRKQLRTPRPYIAAVIALLIFLPYIFWNAAHDFAHLEFIKNASGIKYRGLTPALFALGQITDMHPLTLPVWLSGLYFFFFNHKGKRFRIFGVIYLTAFLILLVNGRSKPEYLAAGYSILLAGGGVQLEMLSEKRSFRWIRYALPFMLITGGALSAPMTLPVLPPETFIQYTRAIGFEAGSPEGKELAGLPQLYADMFGWEEMARTAAEVYSRLSGSERQNTVIFAQNYGEAASLEYYSDKYDLPPVICPHNSFWYWAKESAPREIKTVIIIGGDKEDHLKSLDDVNQAAVVSSRWAIPYENNIPVFVARKPKVNLWTLWPELKIFI